MGYFSEQDLMRGAPCLLDEIAALHPDQEETTTKTTPTTTQPPRKTITTKGGETITVYWSTTLKCYVTIPASER